MALISLRCPSCGADIELDETREFGFCSYCGTKVMMDKQIVEFKGKVTVDGISTVEKLLERAFILVEDKEYLQAETYFNRVLELEPKCAKAYWGKMLCEFKIPYAKTAEIKGIDIKQSNNYNRAILYATGKEKEKYITYGEKTTDAYIAKKRDVNEKQKKAETRSTWLKVIFVIAPILVFVFLLSVAIFDYNVILKILTLLIGIVWLVSCVLVRKELERNIGKQANFKWLINNLWSVVAGISVVGCVLVAFVITPVPEESSEENANAEATTVIVTTTESTTEPLIEISASKLMKAYEDNEIYANNKYKGKKIKLTGCVYDISQSDGWFSESYYVYINNGEKYSYDYISCLLSDTSLEKAVELKAGDKIVVEGVCNGISITSISMSNCEIVS